MATRLKLTNNAVAQLAANVGASSSTAQLGAGQGNQFPSTEDGLPFHVTVTNAGAEREIWKVIERSFDVLTILRAQEGTTAIAFYTGDIVELRLTAGSLMTELNRLESKIDNAIQAFAFPTYQLPTAAQLKSQLTGALTTSEFLSSLTSRINLIDATDVIAGSVNARLKAETDARVTDIQQEIDDRIAAINAEAGARTTYVQNYAYSKESTDSAIAYSASVVTAAYTGYVDAAKSSAVAIASADVRTYAYSKASVDASEAALLSNITASYTSYADSVRDAAISTASADVRQYSYAKATVDGALTALEDELRAEFVASGGATEAYVQNYTYSKAQSDTAEAGQSANITAAYQTYATGKRDEAISTANANVVSYAYSKATIDSSFASQSSAITAAYNDAVTAAAADVRSYSYSKASTDGAIATSINIVNSRLDNMGGSGASVEQRFTTQATTNGGLLAQYTVKTDVNGFVSGFGLASTNAGAAPSSEFIVLASSFKVVMPGATPTAMFSVSAGTVGFSGLLKGPSGSFGSVHIDAGGSLSAGDFTAAGGYNWPAGNGTGFYLNSGGALFGNPANNKYFQIDGGDIYANAFQIVNGVFTLHAAQRVTNANLATGAGHVLDNFSSGFSSTVPFVMPRAGSVIIRARLAIGSADVAGIHLYNEGAVGFPGTIAATGEEYGANPNTQNYDVFIIVPLSAGNYWIGPSNASYPITNAVVTKFIA